MAKSKIFIASSGRTLELAKQLRAQLNPEFCAPELWTEVSQNQVGKSILTMLKEATREYDFAVVILAKDDVMITNLGDTRKARDNCVFEAGLFMGVIGDTRCLLLSSVGQGELAVGSRRDYLHWFHRKRVSILQDQTKTQAHAGRRSLPPPPE